MQLAILVLLAAVVLGLVFVVARFGSLERSLERNERSAREESARLREETARSLECVRTFVSSRLDAVQQEQATGAKALRDEVSASMQGMRSAADANARTLRDEVHMRLAAIQTDNAAKLEQMRATVEEKLQGTLDKRLNESFKLVSERLEKVHQGLGEMQALAEGVGDLKKVLTNVKTRGSWGEIQLGAILDQVLTPDQFGRNVPVTGGAERVEYAIRLPGRDPQDRPVWLPIDSKFPQEDYLRLVEASERGDADAVELAARALENRIRCCARDISDKYVAPPLTTDFALLYLPTEGLYAEALRRPGLAETIQRDYRVVIAGPTTFAAILNSLQMGFRTLAIQKRSSEVWQVLAGIKTEFGKYAGVLARVQKKLQEASNTVEDAAQRTRVLERRLRKVEGDDTLVEEEDMLPLLAQVAGRD